MMAHRQWSYQLSAIEILGYILKLKIPVLSRCVVVQYLDMILDATYNTPDALVKMGALTLLENMFLIFPKGLSSKVNEIRDVVRYACA